MKNYVVRNNRNNGYDFWDDAFDNFFRPALYEGKRGEMKTDIKENENAYVMEVEAAGFDKKDINLSLENGYLTITASKKECEKRLQRQDRLQKRKLYKKREKLLAFEEFLRRRRKERGRKSQIRKRYSDCRNPQRETCRARFAQHRNRIICANSHGSLAMILNKKRVACKSDPLLFIRYAFARQREGVFIMRIFLFPR